MDDGNRIEQIARGVIKAHGADALAVVDKLTKDAFDQGDNDTVVIWGQVRSLILALQQADLLTLDAALRDTTMPGSDMLFSVTCARAEKWWEKNRSDYRRRITEFWASSLVRERIRVHLAIPDAAPVWSDDERPVASGVFLGRSWRDLTLAERAQVARLWYEESFIPFLNNPVVYMSAGKPSVH